MGRLILVCREGHVNVVEAQRKIAQFWRSYVGHTCAADHRAAQVIQIVLPANLHQVAVEQQVLGESSNSSSSLGAVPVPELSQSICKYFT
jgi:hypothetical protein